MGSMLAEIIGMILSLFSLVLDETPRRRVSSPVPTNNNHVTSDTEESEADDDRRQSYINEEYENSHTNEQLTDYTTLDNDGVSSERRSFWKSISKSLFTTLTVMVAMIPSTAAIMAFLYLDLNTTDVCLEWQHHNNTLPFSVKRLRVIGDSVEAVITNLWFPLTSVVLFGWKEFKLRFMSTFYVAFIFGGMTIIYYLFLLVFGVYDTHMSYRYPANLLFLTGIICCSIIILCNIRANRPRNYTLSYSKFHIFALVSAEFLACSALAYIYRYSIVTKFNSIKQENLKFMVAAIAPAITIIPAMICKHFIALGQSSEVVDPGRSFVLVYFIRGGVILLYRTMQADLKSIWLFIGLSLISGFLNFFEKATHGMRIKLWRYIISRLNRTVCCQGLRELPRNTSHYRRLKADLEIQDMLFEY
ncbi:Hypothetical predicted protein, partial [Paramuricea clavata]